MKLAEARNKVVVARLDRSETEEPKYNIVSVGLPSPHLIVGDILVSAPYPDKCPNGSVESTQQAPIGNETREAFAFREKCFAASCVFAQVEGRSPIVAQCTLTFFLPMIMAVLADNPQLEDEVARQLHSIDTILPPGTFFCNAVGKEVNALAISTCFFLKLDSSQTPSLAEDPSSQHVQVTTCKVRIAKFAEADKLQLDQLHLCATTLAAYRCDRWSAAFAFDASRPNATLIVNELELWANFSAALFLQRVAPLHSLFVRQVSCTDDTQEEYWVPHDVPLSRGYHAPTRFPFYTRVTEPCSRYADVLVQRLLVAGTKVLKNGLAALHPNERSLLQTVRHHAEWLNLYTPDMTNPKVA